MSCKEVLHCKDILYQKLEKIYLERKLRGLSPNFYVHISVSDFHFSSIGFPICLQQTIGGAILGVYDSLTDV
jgi:hypothetical protein